MDDDIFYRKRIRGMLEDFYKDVQNARLFEREDTTTMKEFYEFLNNWIDKNFTISD